MKFFLEYWVALKRAFWVGRGVVVGCSMESLNYEKIENILWKILFRLCLLFLGELESND